jgi:adenylate cyclase, class 2
MSFEVEIKFRTDAHHSLAQRLEAMGAVPEAAIDQEDVYLNHPARDFAATNEAFRLRREGSSNKLTYKGPKQGGATKTREEIEIGFTEGSEAHRQMLRVWELLGFRVVAVLRKRRQPYALAYQGRHVEVGLDTAEDLGTFVEVEAIAADAGDLSAAQSAVLSLAEKLGLTDVEPRSYLRMALEYRAGPGAAGGARAASPEKLAGQT